MAHLVSECPELLKEWDYDKNEHSPEEYTQFSSTKVWWKCEKGHSWQAVIYSRARGTGCPICARQKIQRRRNNLAITNPELVEEWDYEKNERPPEDYSHGMMEKVWWKCKEGHSWQAIIYNRSKGAGCPYCSGRCAIVGKTDLATVNPELLKEWDYDKNEHSPEEYTQFSNTEVWWKCKEGHSWHAIIQSRSNGSGCPYCARQKVQRRRDNLVITNPELVMEWDYDKNECPPEDYSYGMRGKVWWKCKEGHSWQTRIYNRSKGAGCPYCSGRYAIVGKTDLATVNPELVKEWDYEKNEHGPEEYTQFSNAKVWWKCKEGHSWQAAIFTRSKGSGCPYCARDRRRKANSEVRP